MKHRGGGGSHFLGDPKGGDVPKVEGGGGVTFFKGSKRGGGSKKSCKPN